MTLRRYVSPRGPHSAETKVEGSRFIADLFPAVSEEEAKAHLASVRKRYFDATHHCYAYAIGAGPETVRYSDDGEPNGTAGLKIHSVLRSRTISDAVCIVTRYFGGTKLGVGGLGRAYSDAAAAAVDGAAMFEKGVLARLRVAYTYDHTNAVMNTVQSRSLRIAGTEYDAERTMLTLLVPPDDVDAVMQRLVDATRGAAECERQGESAVAL